MDQSTSHLVVRDLGTLAYEPALDVQRQTVDEVLSWRTKSGKVDAASLTDARPAGVLLLVEHPPVITVSNRPSAQDHLVATPVALARNAVAVVQTDRGGDITYHGPGQLVAYPILDLNRLHLRLHDYMRLLEEIVIQTCAEYGVLGHRDPTATGVWVGPPPGSKICAMGVRVKQWVSMHGLALNVSTNLAHFDLIVPCGLAGRAVTSLQQQLGAACPSMSSVKHALTHRFVEAVEQRLSVQAPRPPVNPA